MSDDPLFKDVTYYIVGDIDQKVSNFTIFVSFFAFGFFFKVANNCINLLIATGYIAAK